MKHYKIDDITLSVHEQGQGSVILFVHGFPFDYSLWNQVCAILSTDYRVIAPDLRGMGQSEQPGDWKLTTMERFADDLHTLLQTLGVKEKIVICGLSMGGYIAMQYARKYGDELAGLVLCSTKTTADPPAVAENRRKQAVGLTSGTLKLSDVAGTMIPKLFSSATMKNNPKIVSELRLIIESNNPFGCAAATLGMAERPDTTEWLGKLDIPVLVVCGIEDQFSPPSEMRLIADNAKHGTFIEIPNAGHLPPLEQPQQFAKVLHDFLLR